MNWNDYYMNIAIAVRDKANCLGRKVGAIIVKENRIISTGYNGTPEGMLNCTDGGCVRCKNRDKYKNSLGYDVCICVHAEQNAILSAARFGISIENSIAYTTMRPCFDCSKALLQAKVKAIYYLHDWSHPVSELQAQYALIQKQFPGGVKNSNCVILVRIGQITLPQKKRPRFPQRSKGNKTQMNTFAIAPDIFLMNNLG